MPPMRMTQFCALALLSWLGTAGAEFAPERGMLLVAQPQVTGRHFAQTVVLVLHHDDDGTLGLILNRPTDVRARELLGDMDDLRDYNEPIFIGGPVAPTAIAILARGISGSGENRPQAIVDDVYVHSDLELLAGLSPRERRERVRLAGGTTGPGDRAGPMARREWFCKARIHEYATGTLGSAARAPERAPRSYGPAHWLAESIRLELDAGPDRDTNGSVWRSAGRFHACPTPITLGSRRRSRRSTGPAIESREFRCPTRQQ
jgi:putative transcriptional regulator